jgi:hypothetical protein
MQKWMTWLESATDWTCCAPIARWCQVLVMTTVTAVLSMFPVHVMVLPEML